MNSRKSVPGLINRAEVPSPDLECFFYDSDRPATVTIANIDSTGPLATEWITARIDQSIPPDSIQ